MLAFDMSNGSQRRLSALGMVSISVLAGTFGMVVGLHFSDQLPGVQGHKPSFSNVVAFRVAAIATDVLPKPFARRLNETVSDFELIRGEAQRIQRWPLELRSTRTVRRWMKSMLLGAAGGGLAPLVLLILYRQGRPLITKYGQAGQRFFMSSSAIWIGAHKFKPQSYRLGLLLMGSMNSGKSTVIKAVARYVRKKQECAIAVDYRSELFVPLFRDDRDALIFSGDERSQSYSIFFDIFEYEDCDLAADVLFPVRCGDANSREWRTNAWTFGRSCLRVVWRERQSCSEVGLDRFKHLLFSADQDELQLLLPPDDPVVALLSNDAGRFLQSVRGVAAFAGKALDLMLPNSGFNGFSVRRWVQESVGTDAWLFVGVGGRQKKAEFALASLVLGVAAFEKARLNDSSKHLWMLMDEFGQIPAMDDLPEHLSTGRKYGLAYVAAIQNVGQLHSAWGESDAATLTEGFGTKAIFRAQEPRHLDWAVKLLGARRLSKVSRGSSISQGPTASKTHSVQTTESVEHLVSTRDISGLPDYECFVLPASGGEPIRTKSSEVILGPARNVGFTDPMAPRVQIVPAIDSGAVGSSAEASISNDWIDAEDILGRGIVSRSAPVDISETDD